MTSKYRTWPTAEAMWKQILDQLKDYFVTQLLKDDATVPNDVPFPGGVQVRCYGKKSEQTFWPAQ